LRPLLVYHRLSGLTQPDVLQYNVKERFYVCTDSEP